jgi:hypothetical protein
MSFSIFGFSKKTVSNAIGFADGAVATSAGVVAVIYAHKALHSMIGGKFKQGTAMGLTSVVSGTLAAYRFFQIFEKIFQQDLESLAAKIVIDTNEIKKIDFGALLKPLAGERLSFSQKWKVLVKAFHNQQQGLLKENEILAYLLAQRITPLNPFIRLAQAKTFAEMDQHLTSLGQLLHNINWIDFIGVTGLSNIEKEEVAKCTIDRIISLLKPSLNNLPPEEKLSMSKRFDNFLSDWNEILFNHFAAVKVPSIKPLPAPEPNPPAYPQPDFKQPLNQIVPSIFTK